MVPTACHEDFIDVLLDCYYKLSQSPDLKPSASINCLFERLVGLCTQIPNEAVTSQVSHSHTGYNDHSPLHERPRYSQTLGSLTLRLICVSFAQMAKINSKLIGRERCVAARHTKKVSSSHVPCSFS